MAAGPTYSPSKPRCPKRSARRPPRPRPESPTYDAAKASSPRKSTTNPTTTSTSPNSKGLVDDILTQDDDTDLPAARALFQPLIEGIEIDSHRHPANVPRTRGSCCVWVSGR